MRFLIYFEISYSDVVTFVIENEKIKIEGCIMSIDTSKGHPAMDYPEHERTYNGFIKATIYSTVGLVALMAAMAFFLV